MNQQPIGSDEARNVKDFLMLRNSLTEKCFCKCVVQLYSDTLSSREIKCVEKCTERFKEGNERVMKNFIAIQQQKQKAEMAEMQKQNQVLTTSPG